MNKYVGDGLTQNIHFKEIDTSSLIPGMYILKIVSKNRTYLERFVKK
jgi:hypothetical protein